MPVPGRLSPSNPEGLPGRQEEQGGLQLMSVKGELVLLCGILTSGGILPLYSEIISFSHQALAGLKMNAIPRLELLVRGLKREQAGQPSKPRLPEMLWRVCAYWRDSQE